MHDSETLHDGGIDVIGPLQGKSEPFCGLRGGFAFVKTKVFDHADLSWQQVVNSAPYVRTCDGGKHGHRSVDQFGESSCHGREAESGVLGTLWSPEVASNYHCRVPGEEPAKGRQERANTTIVGDDTAV
jgi:hypothetical protein